MTSPYRGVYWDTPRGRWAARGKTNGRSHLLGRFDSEYEAALVASDWRISNLGRKHLLRVYVVKPRYRPLHRLMWQNSEGRWFVRDRAGNPYTWARIVMADKIGRLLTPDEHVHHLNHVKWDDRPENLTVVTKAEHPTHHPEAGTRSWQVRKPAFDAYRREIQRRWLAGASLSELCDALGVGDLSATMRRMRDDGWYLPRAKERNRLLARGKQQRGIR